MVHVTESHKGAFHTVSGIEFSILNPTLEMINTEDMIIGLSNECRFGKQLDDYYSVAQHSILVWMLAPKELKRAALIHDGSEAFFGDVIKPLKNLLPAYEEIEHRLMALIAEKYGVSEYDLVAIKPYDTEALILEDAVLRHQTPSAIAEWESLWAQQHHDGRCWLPKRARAELTKRFRMEGLL